MVLISPSILSWISNPIEAIKRIPNADFIHIDVMDGRFVKDKNSFSDTNILKDIQKSTNILLDTHLMIEEPENHVKDFCQYSDIVTFHYEAVDKEKIINIINLIKNTGTKAGISLKPDTNLEKIEPFLKDLDLVLLMSVIPGKGGQGFIKETLNKIKALKEIKKKNNLDFIIEVDGGIKLENIHKVINAGADMIVSGTGILDIEIEPKKVIERMKETILIASDHGGFKLKEKIKKHLEEKEIAYEDLGTHTEESCDFPDYAKALSKKIADKKNKRGILICGTGIGMSVTANRFKGVRATLCHNEFTAEMSREHNDSNVLCLGERSTNNDLALKIVDIWLETPASKVQKYKKRMDMIDE